LVTSGDAAASDCEVARGAGRIHDGGAAGDGVGDDLLRRRRGSVVSHANAWHDGFGRNWDGIGLIGDTGICAQRGGPCGFADRLDADGGSIAGQEEIVSSREIAHW